MKKNVGKEKYILQLYVNGSKPSSARAIKNTYKLYEDYLDENYKIEIIDLNEHPLLAFKEDIVATPTLIIKKLPDSLQKLIGDLSSIDHVMVGLNLKKL
ncbi:MAG TPA: circadian clock KaiB family protein [Ignavibacteriaceae bacterium]|nr:circadian clock KaiB family protein [Ignavibacteriaceae bacterium]